MSQLCLSFLFEVIINIYQCQCQYQYQYLKISTKFIEEKEIKKVNTQFNIKYV